jgi:AcrR family transcriptional regulator
VATRGTAKRLGRPSFSEVAEGERRAEILRVAGRLFQQRGYAAVSLSDIAAGVGVTKAAVLHHFGSKAGLYAAIMRETLESIGAAIRRTADSPESFAEILVHLAYTAIVWVDADADLDAMLHDADEHLSPEDRREIAAAHQAIMTAMEDVMRQGIAGGDIADRDPRFLAYAYWHWIGSFGGRRGAEASFQGRPGITTAVVDLFLHGARTPPLGAPDSIGGESIGSGSRRP